MKRIIIEVNSTETNEKIKAYLERFIIENFRDEKSTIKIEDVK